MYHISFLGQTHFQWECFCILAIASKSLFLKHQEGSTQHETFLIVSPGSLHMNASIENIVYTEFIKNKGF